MAQQTAQHLAPARNHIRACCMKESFPQPCHTDRTADRAAPRPGELLTLLVTQAFLRLAQVRRGRQQTRPGAPGPRLLGGRVHDELRARRADELHILGAHVAHDAPEVAALVGPEHRDGGAGLARAAGAAGAVQERLRVLGQVVVHHLRARATLHRVGVAPRIALCFARSQARATRRAGRQAAAADSPAPEHGHARFRRRPARMPASSKACI